jgi:hypothetical protein
MHSGETVYSIMNVMNAMHQVYTSYQTSAASIAVTIIARAPRRSLSNPAHTYNYILLSLGSI